MKNLQYTQINQKLQQLMEQKNYTEAVVLAQQVLNSDSTYFPWWKILGAIYAILKDYENALNCFSKVLTLNPNDHTVYNNLGNLEKDQGNFKEAKKYYLKAIKIEPSYFLSYYNLGNLEKQENNFKKAKEYYKKVIELTPKYSKAYYNLGNLEKQEGNLIEAQKSYKGAIDANPNHYEAYNNLGLIAFDQGNYKEAKKLYEKALRIQPRFANGHFNKSLLLLKEGKLKEGFKLYEWRKELDNAELDINKYHKPLWLGKGSLKNKKILIYNEQGLGDTIQFCRYIFMLVDLGAKVIFATNDELYTFLSQIKGVAEFIKRGDPLPSFDYHCPLLSLPLAFKTTLKDIPYSQSYLKANDEKVEMWRKKLGEHNTIKIGLVWSGNVKHHNDTNRSIDLEKLLRVLPQELEYISLQKELRETDKEISQEIKFFGDELKDFSDTAALCSIMDLIITVDTSVAHLAGALGKKTWILLPSSSDWRWLTKRDDSPWYSSVKLYRTIDNRWESTLSKVKKDLEKFVEQY